VGVLYEYQYHNKASVLEMQKHQARRKCSLKKEQTRTNIWMKKSLGIFFNLNVLKTL